MEDIAIRVVNLSKMYKLYDKPSDRLKETLGIGKIKAKEHFALNEVSFDIKRGETVGIIGTNGSGKSTILKIITGVLNPTGGQLAVEGRISALLELGAGFNMEYTGIENVYLNGTMIGFTREEIDAKLREIIEFADIGDFINQPVKTYSSGMFVRLAFAVAINIEPEILIVDEALSVGDVFFQTKCYRKFDEFKKMGKTILFVSHDLGSISKYCDRVVLLNRGNKLAEGSPKDMIDMYKKVLVGQEPTEKNVMAGTLDDVTDAAHAAESDRGVLHAAEFTAMDQSVSWKDYMLVNPDLQSYGDNRAVIEDFGIFDREGNITNTVYKMEEFSIKLKIRFQQEIQNPIFAYSLKDLKGTELTGTNTIIEKVDTGFVKKEEEIIVSFAQKMILQGGQYLLQLGCTGFEKDELVVYHRLYDICCIQVIADKTTVGYCDMDSKVCYVRS